MSGLVFVFLAVALRLKDGDPESSEDLTSDYHDLAVAVQGLGFLESGITEPLNQFSNTLLEFSALLRHTVSAILSVASTAVILILPRPKLPRTLSSTTSTPFSPTRTPTAPSSSSATKSSLTLKSSQITYLASPLSATGCRLSSAGMLGARA